MNRSTDPQLCSRPCAFACLLLAALLGCAEKNPSEPGARKMQPDPFGNVAGSSPGAAAGTAAPAAFDAGNGTQLPPTHWGDGGTTQACATAASSTELEPVHLAFAFDVSGSMGKGDEPWHDKSLKWDPVVLATRTFFQDPASKGLTASLTFFPDEGDEDERCVEAAYEEPDVEMTALPSEAFGDAIDAIEPASSDDWRGGTPTVFVARGTKTFVDGYRGDHPGRYAIVLVTDGYPQGCSDDDDTIDAVAAVIEDARALEIDSYVIGVANPPIEGAPDTVSDLHALAAAGGTGQAFLIDTGDPVATATNFGEAIDAIRQTAISCSLAIPDPPDGKSFDKERVAVHFTGSSGVKQSFRYDAGCSNAEAWHYDDPAAPGEIVLCESTCDAVQSDSAAAFEVEFACEQLFSVD